MRPLNDILQDRHMRPQVKTLKDHPQPRTQALYLPGIRRQPMPAGVVLHFNRLATDADHPGIGRFQQINAAQQRTFTGAAGAEDRNDIALPGLESDPLQDIQGAKGLMNIADR